jgi:hypothetical protein
MLIAFVGLGAGVATSSVGAPAGHSRKHHKHHAPRIRTYNKCKRSAIDVPSCGVLWGAYRPPVAAKPYWKQHYNQFERPMGRRFDLVKNYEGWAKGDVFPSQREAVLAKHGRRILYFSWNALNFSTRAKISFASIARGDWDRSVIIPEAKRLKAFHQKVFIDFNHEFDAADHAGTGTPQQFAAAYRHIHDVMALMGVTNVIWSWVSTGWKGNRPAIAAGYPGAKYVDWIGWDPFNMAYCRGETGQPDAYGNFSPFYHWAIHQKGMEHKPFLLSEYAAAVQSPNAQRWYSSIDNALRRLPRIKALMQFSGHATSKCDVSLADSSAAMTGFSQSGMAPVVTGAH